ncbi:MAG: hypothetical protein EOO64_00685 [Massilia sp.]|nr:MAG: hypothetical protein EOO64_00685 [Massilia sp.]
MNDRLRDWEAPPPDATPFWFQSRGRAFEVIIKRILSNEGMEPRGSLRPSGEEIDGAFCMFSRTFLLEAKWRKDAIPASDLYAFKGKVDGKLVGTLGVFISMSGYSKDAIDALKAGKEINLILFDAEDLRLVDEGVLTFEEAMKRKLRFAAEEGLPYRPLGSDKAAQTTTSVLKFMTVSEDELESATTDDSVWDVIVEGRSDETAMRIVFDRLGVGDKVRLWAAGGQSPVPALVRRLQESKHDRVAAIVEPDMSAQLSAELSALFNADPDRLVVPYRSIEETLEMACPDEYTLTLPGTSNRDKAARRLASHADIGLVLRHQKFAPLFKQILGQALYDALLAQHPVRS